MKIELTIKEKEELESRHSKERDGRVRDRIKAVLLNAEGWTQKQIAQALRIRLTKQSKTTSMITRRARSSRAKMADQKAI